MRRVRFLFPTLCLALPAGLIFAKLATSKEIRETMGELSDRAQAIVDLATEEERELTDVEKGEIDGILGSGKKGVADYKPGKLDKLEADLERAEKLEARQSEMTARRNPTPQRSDGPGGDIQDNEPPALETRIRIPAQARFRHSRLKAYTGQHAEQRAYIAGRFLLAVLGNHQPSVQWCRDQGVAIQAAHSGNSNAAGGYLVPDVMEMSIIDLRETRGVFRRFANVKLMSSDTLTIPRRKGGLTAYAVGEADEITASTKNWDAVKLVAKKFGVLSKWPSELDEDAVISLADDLTKEIAYAFADKEDQCGFNGDGTSTYHGTVGLKNKLKAGSVYTALAGNTAFSTLDMADFEGMVGLLPEYAEADAAWYISKRGYSASMLRLLDAAGGNTTAELAKGDGKEFLGYPVRISQVLNSTLAAQAATTGLCYLGDLRQGAILGNRRGISVATSSDRYFETDELAIKGTERVDVNVHEDGDANNPGSMIVLATP